MHPCSSATSKLVPLTEWQTNLLHTSIRQPLCLGPALSVVALSVLPSCPFPLTYNKTCVFTNTVQLLHVCSWHLHCCRTSSLPLPQLCTCPSCQIGEGICFYLPTDSLHQDWANHVRILYIALAGLSTWWERHVCLQWPWPFRAFVVYMIQCIPSVPQYWIVLEIYIQTVIVFGSDFQPYKSVHGTKPHGSLPRLKFELGI